MKLLTSEESIYKLLALQDAIYQLNPFF